MKLLIPPIAPIMFAKIRAIFLRESLFGGDDQLFMEELAGVEIYGEYGCGASTKWVLQNTKAKVIAVDTSEAWVAAVKSGHEQFGERLTFASLIWERSGNGEGPATTREGISLQSILTTSGIKPKNHSWYC